MDGAGSEKERGGRGASDPAGIGGAARKGRLGIAMSGQRRRAHELRQSNMAREIPRHSLC